MLHSGSAFGVLDLSIHQTTDIQFCANGDLFGAHLAVRCFALRRDFFQFYSVVDAGCRRIKLENFDRRLAGVETGIAQVGGLFFIGLALFKLKPSALEVFVKPFECFHDFPPHA